MRNILFLIIAFIFHYSCPAQNLSFPGVFSSISMEEKEDSLFMEIDIHVNPWSVTSKQSLTIIPELINGEDQSSLQFPHILINGKRKAQMHKRRICFKDKKLINNPPYIQIDLKPSTDSILHYQYAVPYENWMDSAGLRVHQVIGACANSERWYTVENKAFIKFEVYTPYEPNLQVNYIEPEKEIKQRDMQGEAYLDFPVGQSVILPEFRRNPEELRKIHATINEVKDDVDITITGLQIVGYASPEGSYAMNEKLSFNRSQALKEYIRNYYNLPNDLFHVSSIAEDWEGLRKLVEENELPSKERILSIIDNYEAPDRKEQQLKALGAPYYKLLNDLFPQLRRVKYRIDYTVRDYTTEETNILLEKRPEHLSTRELFVLAETHPINSDRWNELMDFSVRLYPQDPIANINVAASLLKRGQYERAKVHLDMADNHPLSTNNLGIYYLLTNQPDEAEFYFKQAIQNGIEEATVNLQEVENVRLDLLKLEKRNRK